MMCASPVHGPRVRLRQLLAACPLLLALTGCGLGPIRPPSEVKPSNVNADAILTPATRITRELAKLPAPMYKVPVAVYAFRDQTGQFRPQPESNLSNAVTQGAAAILVKSLLDSGWYLPIEREGFQNLLNERRVARAIEVPADRGKPGSSYPTLIPAQFILEGGIVGYETNVRTGGQGANLLGIGGETKYRIDQVTVNLRSIDVRTGQVVNSVSVTKTIFSHEISASIYRFVAYKTLLQAEGGYSSNEPSQLAVKEAIESAVIHLTVQGIANRVWALRNEQDWSSATVQAYARDAELQLSDPDAQRTAEAPVLPMREPRLVIPPSLPIHMQLMPARGETVGPAAGLAVPESASNRPTSSRAAAQTPTPAPAGAATPAPAPAALPAPAPAPAAAPTTVVSAPLPLPATSEVTPSAPAAGPVPAPAAPSRPPQTPVPATATGQAESPPLRPTQAAQSTSPHMAPKLPQLAPAHETIQDMQDDLVVMQDTQAWTGP